MRFGHLMALSTLLLTCACVPEGDVSEPLENEGIASRLPRSIELPKTRPRFPIRWRIGDIDTRFGLGSDEVKGAMERAIKVWESGAHRQLFAQDSAGFPVRLVFDRRQERVDAARKAQKSLDVQEKHLRMAKVGTGEAAARFESAESALNARFERRDASVENYNLRVRAINDSGGANEAEAEELEALKATLTEVDSSLESHKQEVEALRTEANNLADNYNRLVAQHNEAVRKFNEQFGRAVEETIGECRTTGSVPDEITIYSFDTADHLAVVLAHELGHALGIEHVKGDGALMSAVEKGMPRAKSLRLTQRDQDALSRVLGH